MSKFQVGDVLRVREWDDLVDEYGISTIGSIKCKFPFVRSMRYMCGETFTVRQISGGACYKSEEGIERDFYISADMLEYDISDNIETHYDDTEIAQFMNAYQTSGRRESER